MEETKKNILKRLFCENLDDIQSDELKILFANKNASKIDLISKMRSSSLLERVKLLLFFQERLHDEKKELLQLVYQKNNACKNIRLMLSHLKKAINNEDSLEPFITNELIDCQIKNRIHAYSKSREVFKKSFEKYTSQFNNNLYDSMSKLNIESKPKLFQHDLVSFSKDLNRSFMLSNLEIKIDSYFEGQIPISKQYIIKKNDFLKILFSNKAPAALFLEFTKWRITNNTPGEVFITYKTPSLTDEESKDTITQYVNFKIPLFMVLFQDVLKNATDLITISEFSYA